MEAIHREKRGIIMSKIYYFCVECGIHNLYEYKKDLMLHYPVLKEHPELIYQIEIELGDFKKVD